MTDTTPTPKTRTFTILAALPYTFGDPRCCSAYMAELWQGPAHDDEDDNYLLTFTHSTDCDVWQYIP
jgi:hypothetical protein